MSHWPCPALSPNVPATAIVARSAHAVHPARWRIAACALLLAACMPTRSAPSGLEFVIVRHAEKRSDDPHDPHLTQAGLARAQRLADSLASRPLAATYATAYRRTLQTAAPAAAAHGLAVTGYDAKQDANEFAATLRLRHVGGTVLVVGHSNTVPTIAAALCGCKVAPIGDDAYDRRLSVRFGDHGQATLIDTRTP